MAASARGEPMAAGFLFGLSLAQLISWGSTFYLFGLLVQPIEAELRIGRAQSALAFSLMNPETQGPLIGASGAVAGVVAAYLMFYPRMRVFGLAFNVVPFRIPAWVALGLWIGAQIVSALFLPRGEVSFWAHVGGILTGAALTPFLRRPGHPLGWPRRPPGDPV